jgi:hypothetical protein
VGVNKYRLPAGQESKHQVLAIDNAAVRESQIKRLEEMKVKRPLTLQPLPQLVALYNPISVSFIICMLSLFTYALLVYTYIYIYIYIIMHVCII